MAAFTATGASSSRWSQWRPSPATGLWYSWRRADHPVSDRFAWLMFADGTLALLSLLKFVSPTDRISVIWMAPLAMSAAFAAVF